MYKVEDKESRECFSILCGTFINEEYMTNTLFIYAYTLSEAKQKCIDEGYDVYD